MKCNLCGYHVYQPLWTDDILTCRREPTNVRDKYALPVIEDDGIVGYITWKFLMFIHFFFKEEEVLLVQ